MLFEEVVLAVNPRLAIRACLSRTDVPPELGRPTPAKVVGGIEAVDAARCE